MDTGNTGTGAYEGRGAVLDRIDINAGVPYPKGDSGGESTAEGLWAMILIKNAVTTNSLGQSSMLSRRASTARARLRSPCDSSRRRLWVRSRM